MKADVYTVCMHAHMGILQPIDNVWIEAPCFNIMPSESAAQSKVVASLGPDL